MKNPQTLEANKNLVRSFQQLCFSDCKPAEAVALYLSPHYLLHNPDVEDGAASITRYFENYIAMFREPFTTSVRIEAENDFVVLQVRFKKDEAGEDVHVSIFRIENDKIAEHWEVIKPSCYRKKPE